MSPSSADPASSTSPRTVFISDVHLGYRGCQAEFLLGFLRGLTATRLVLVGDIIDLWSMKRRPFWPESHQAVVREFTRLASDGVEVIYVPGNHDEEIRDFCGSVFAGIEIRRDFIHEAADGRRYLVLHGDDFDGAVKFSGFLRHVGERMYDALMVLGRIIVRVRRRFGFGYWSLASWLKDQVPDARLYIERFEHAAAHAALRHGLDGVICGHIHRPQIRTVDGVLYCNDGDWVEHCSALVEDRSGRMSIVRCVDRSAVQTSASVEVRAPAPAHAPAFDTAA
jgi:UDP-2,3-diacylglucosamine pyrophosphatase LpxH